MDDQTPEAPGWDAIDAALRPLYGDQEPLHYAATPHWAAGGNDPLDGISVYAAANPPHWHFVSYGMSELYAKDSENAELSGWGFEFTFRLARRDEAEPPAWALNFLQNLARYVFQSGNVFEAGHHMNLNGPIALGRETAIRAIAFAGDPELGTIDTPHGALTFLQVVGLTLDEYDVIQEWDTAQLLALTAGGNPLLVTDLQRTSRLADHAFARAVMEGRTRDGSSQYAAFVSHVEWQVGNEAQLVLGATAMSSLLRLLPYRLPYERSFALVASEATLRVDPGDQPGWQADEDAFVVTLPPADCAAFCAALAARRGRYRWPALPGLEIEVVPSEIKDRDGNVVEVIG